MPRQVLPRHSVPITPPIVGSISCRPFFGYLCLRPGYLGQNGCEQQFHATHPQYMPDAAPQMQRTYMQHPHHAAPHTMYNQQIPAPHSHPQQQMSSPHGANPMPLPGCVMDLDPLRVFSNDEYKKWNLDIKDGKSMRPWDGTSEAYEAWRDLIADQCST